MRAVVVKRMRKSVYGDLSPRTRRYGRNPATGTIYADDLRRLYRKAKKNRKGGI